MIQQKLQYSLSEDILANVLVAYHKAKTDKTKSSSLSQTTIQNVINLGSGINPNDIK